MISFPAVRSALKSAWIKTLYVVVFFTVTPIALLASLLSLVSLQNQDKIEQPKNKAVLGSNIGNQIFASLPGTYPSISGEVIASDARIDIIRLYLLEYDSPLAPYAEAIVKAADKHGLDYRLITAIAQQESNLCKKIPENTFNCWGWGIHSQGTLGFSSFEEGIEVVSKGLKENYIKKGLTDPEAIMAKYTPMSNGSWAYGVNLFMREMQ